MSDSFAVKRNSLNRFAIDGQATAASGAAARAIVDLAEKCRAELVVVGTRYRAGCACLTLGGTAKAVIRSAPCSVLILRLAAEAFTLSRDGYLESMTHNVESCGCAR